MRSECHRLAEYILRFPARTEAEKFLRAQIALGLTDRVTIGEWSIKFQDHINEEEILNPYLRELERNYRGGTDAESA